MRFIATLLLLLFAAPALAQTPGNCESGTAEGDLNVSDVLARLFNTGSIAFGNDTVSGDGYLVPQATGHSPLFAAGIWVGGMVGGDERRIQQSRESWNCGLCFRKIVADDLLAPPAIGTRIASAEHASNAAGAFPYGLPDITAGEAIAEAHVHGSSLRNTLTRSNY